MINTGVFLDLTVDSELIGRVELELFDDIVPKTVENFKVLCYGNDEIDSRYDGCPVHRVIPNFMMQSGDFIFGNGFGGESIYGGKFNDENFQLKHDKPGLLSMANSGPNTNSSQFFITFVETPWLDGKHVVFGEVTSGMDVLAEVEKLWKDKRRH
jgi:peptidylprolyl isomerase